MLKLSKWAVLPLVVAWLMWCGCCVGDHADHAECPARTRPYEASELAFRDTGGLGALVNSAMSTRNVIVQDDLPYKFIGERAREAYNGSHLSSSHFIDHWTKYTQNALFVSGFVLFVGVLLPGVAVALWTFWECCYEEDEEEENRNLTGQAQVVVWSLSVALGAVLCVLVVLVGILLVGNSWISHGVAQGREVAHQTIPQVMELKQSALQKLDTTLVGRYEDLVSQLQTNLLNETTVNVTQTTSNTFNSSVVKLNEKVADQLEQQPRLLGLTHSLTHLLHSHLPTLTASLNHTLTLLQHQCTLTLEAQTGSSVNSSLLTQCEDYLANFSSHVPISRWQEVGGVSDNESQSLLSVLEWLLADSAFKEDPGSLPAKMFKKYLKELEADLSGHIDNTSNRYLSSLASNLSDFNEEVVTFYNGSLPLLSQPRVELYLGARYLDNWEWFRSALTVTFAVLVLLGSVCLLVAVGRGLFNILAIYRYAEDTEYDHAAHQAGIMIKKLAFSLSVLCVLSAAFSGFFLSVATVMGKACGSHGNFSELLVNVIDRPQTWSEEDSAHYPLAAVILDRPQYTLTVAGTLAACRVNVSLFHALHLEQRYDLADRIWLNPQEKVAYREAMRNISLYLGGASLTSTGLEGQLGRLEAAAVVPVQWSDLTSLSPSSVFQPGFVGLEQLRTVLEDLVSSVNDSTHNLSVAAVSALDSLTDLYNELEPSLSAAHSNATQLQSSLAALTPLSLNLSSLATNITINTTSKSNQLVTLTSEDVNRQLDRYIDSSISTLSCDLGSCRALVDGYDKFSAAVCGDVVPGMDLYWTTLMMILAVSVLLMLTTLLVASRFVSLEIEKSNRKNPKFYLNGAVMRQARGTLWQLISLAVYLWWVVHVSQDSHAQQEFCTGAQASCCEKCVWVFGVVFLLLSVAVGGCSRAYQFFTIYMIKKCQVMKYRRFWIERKKAVNFYGQLGLWLLQDLPFLILAGTYANMGFLDVPAFYCLGISLIGIVTYLAYLITERQNIFTYWTWLKLELKKLGRAESYTNQEPLPNANSGNVAAPPRRGGANIPNGHAHSVRSPYESSGSDHSEESSQTFQDHGFEFHPPRLSDIPEYPEGGLEAAAMAAGPSRMAPLEPHLLHDEDGHTDTEMSEQNSQFQSRVRLDRDIELDSDAYMQRRREAIEHFERGGVEVAPAHYYHRDLETSTISDSYYYGSRNSMEMQGYVSSSQAPDTNSYYESSDCREEDGDSEYSQARYRLPLPSFMGEVTVDV